MASQNKKITLKNNLNVNMLLKNPVPIRPKPTVLEHNFIDFTSEPASAATTSKEMPIDLTMILEKEVKINDDNSKWSEMKIKILLNYWRENLEEWKRGKVKVYQKMVNENLLPGRTLEQIRNKVGKLRKMYLQKKKKTNSTGESNVEWIWYSQMEEIFSQSKAVNPDYITGSSASDFISDTENLDDKENHETETDKPQKKKRRSGIDNLSGVIAAMGESRDRFYEKKIDSKLQESQKRFELKEKKLNQQYELEKNKLEIEKLRAENEKVKLELEMLKFHKIINKNLYKFL
ncbi:hypothetical protein C1645_733135 [Glomus cerebriforme]|uniref:Uncharacterized protein n=1 Tax=Glomus cerebriforme TaxID=658196 RepID=A0A397TJ93_9GLOM|nr:hypothetical protein C1645_733135 [Glomus cerebriforme]